MINLGLLGGTFDPVHYAHTQLAKAALDELSLDKLIVMPAYIQPFKRDRFITSDEHRLAMLNIAFSNMDNIEISTWEIDRGGISYTYDTITHFRELYPSSKIWFLMGTDSLLKLEKWHKGIELLKVCSFAVGSRPEYDLSKLREEADYYKAKYGTEIYIMNSDMPPISSTMVRELVEEDKPISGLVTPGVEDYIYEQGLYREYSL